MNDDRENRRARRARPESRGATQVVQVKMPRLLAGDTSGLRIQLLGHFRVWIGSREIEDGEWFLHKVQHLVKLLALAPDHRLHRRQLMYVLWPEMDPDAAATTLYKALHLVRRILEPDLPSDRPSSYLHLCGEFVILQSPRSLWIDVEAFQAAAAVARQSGSLDAYEETLRWYGGDLLPQDPYEAWAIRQREELAALHQHLLVELASLYEQAGKMSQAADILWQMATGEPAHGEGQARLIALVARSESPQVAVDQDELLQLQHNVGVEPGPSGQELHNKIHRGTVTSGVHPTPTPLSILPAALQHSVGAEALVGRDGELGQLGEMLDKTLGGQGRVVLVSGEAGIGKTRLVAEAARWATERGAITAWRAHFRRTGPVPYHLFRAVLCDLSLQIAPDALGPLLGDLGPELAPLISATLSVRQVQQHPSTSTHTLETVVRGVSSFFCRISRHAPVVVVLEDLHVADRESLLILERLAHEARALPLLLLCTLRPGEVTGGSALGRMLITLASREQLDCVDLARLTRDQTDRMVTRVLGTPFDPRVLDMIQQLAQGNPHYINEAVQALRGRRRIEQVNGAWHLRDGGAPAWSRNQLRRPRGGRLNHQLAPYMSTG